MVLLLIRHISPLVVHQEGHVWLQRVDRHRITVKFGFSNNQQDRNDSYLRLLPSRKPPRDNPKTSTTSFFEVGNIINTVDRKLPIPCSELEAGTSMVVYLEPSKPQSFSRGPACSFLSILFFACCPLRTQKPFRDNPLGVNDHFSE